MSLAACTGHQKRETGKLSLIKLISLGLYLVKCKQQGKFFFFKILKSPKELTITDF